jgi:tousled-like kinase
MHMHVLYPQLRLGTLKREEESLRQEEERLNGEKLRHVRLLKRVRDENASRFSGMEVLAKRYQLLNLLGKGGFSEVYKVRCMGGRGRVLWG